MKTGSLNNHAIYLPEVSDSYASTICKQLPAGRPFPAGLGLGDLVFWEPNSLWHYPYLLHSVGLHSIGSFPNNAVTQRSRASSTLIGDSGGYQIGKGTLKGLISVKQRPMKALVAQTAWKSEYAARKWIVGWLDTHADYGMTIDMPLWATSKDGENSPFHSCTAAELTAMTVDNLKFIKTHASEGSKWLNVVQGGDNAAGIKAWWDAVKWFREGGWAIAGGAGAKGGIANMLKTLLMMRDDNAFDSGQDWVHVLGVSTTKWSVMLTAIQQALQKTNPALRVSFDSASPFQTGGRYENVVLTPAFGSSPKTWSFGTELAPQGPQYASQHAMTAFKHNQSPLGQRLLLGHLNVNGGIWNHRNFDAISNALLINHNVWVYLDAFETANYLAAANDKARVPALYLECIAFIADVFQSSSWMTEIAKHKRMLDAVAPMSKRLSNSAVIT